MTADLGNLEELRQRLSRGEANALGELFAHYREPLRRMVAQGLNPRLNARVSPSDVLQEVYLDAAQRLRHFFAKPDQSLFGWLRLLVRQRLHDVFRRHLQARARAADQEIHFDQQRADPAGGSSTLGLQLAANLPSPSQEAMRHEASLQLEAALAKMDAIDREVLVLRHFEELSNKDVALVLGIPPAAASKRYIRALARLKETLEDFPGFSSQGRQPICEAHP